MAPVNLSVFNRDAVPKAAEDPLFGLMAAYKKDTSENKVDLGIGAYRDDNAKPWVLPVVKRVCCIVKFLEPFNTFVQHKQKLKSILYQADDIIRNDPNLNNEYLPIAGLPEFTNASQKLLLGSDSPAIKEKRVSTLLQHCSRSSVKDRL
jgi:aspartate aminotransferase, cytoplasmic